MNSLDSIFKHFVQEVHNLTIEDEPITKANWKKMKEVPGTYWFIK